ncbi:MAG: hypothetical protein A3I66_13715 [Burkholderiales bacterium RIFCSPLOWO2_02_FULL_57_36]|nr:MAG: hypothetical protein A3I66_13715 [Burkholderiales bacterium RIFCSPLOWO2_02_FULL_57_36]
MKALTKVTYWKNPEIMMPTFTERQQLAKEFAPQIERMAHCLAAAGYDVKVDRIVRAWTAYSDAVCATWISLSDEGDDAALLDILLKHMPAMPRKDEASGAFTAQLMDAGDGSGDAMLELPDELLALVGWKEGDVLIMAITEAGELRLKRTDR